MILAPIPERGNRVLLAEDERHIAKLLRTRFTRLGYEITCAYDGREAIHLLQTQPFDQAILDPTMPNVDGYEVLKWIRTHEATEHMWVGMMTSQAEAMEHDYYNQYRADAYL